MNSQKTTTLAVALFSILFTPPASAEGGKCQDWIGRWQGEWSKGGFGRITLNIKKVDGQCNVAFKYSGRPYEGKIDDGILRFPCGSQGGTCLFSRSSDSSKLNASYLNPSGDTNNAVFNKKVEEANTQPLDSGGGAAPENQTQDSDKPIAIPSNADIPSACAVFSGEWQGFWNGDARLLVANIDRDCYADYVYSKKSVSRGRSKIEGGKLSFTSKAGAALSFQHTEGKLEATYLGGENARTSLYTTFTRIK